MPAALVSTLFICSNSKLEHEVGLSSSSFELDAGSRACRQ
jgi:hypothetical protein